MIRSNFFFRASGLSFQILAPIDQILRVEVTKEGDVALFGEAVELRLKDVPELLDGDEARLRDSASFTVGSARTAFTSSLLSDLCWKLRVTSPACSRIWFWRRRESVLIGREAYRQSTWGNGSGGRRDRLSLRIGGCGERRH
jgi:hypothetical protein